MWNFIVGFICGIIASYFFYTTFFKAVELTEEEYEDLKRKRKQ